ncbi:hypothetical protein QD357_30295 [Rhizobium sp. BR 317]
MLSRFQKYGPTKLVQSKMELAAWLEKKIQSQADCFLMTMAMPLFLGFF